MRIGSSIALIAIGAILAFAVTPGIIPYIDQTLIGYILMGVGALGLIISLIMASTHRPDRIVEHRETET